MNKLIVVFLIFAVSINAQTANKNLPQEPELYYWFSVKLSKTTDRNTGTDQVIIKNIGYEISSGKFVDFIKNHRQARKSGNITIGPFFEKHDAEYSQSLYRSESRYFDTEPKKKDPDDIEPIYSFFYVKPLTNDSLQEIGFERIPSRVTTGTEAEFMAILTEGLGFDRFAVGPFTRYALAEKAKFVYLKSDETAGNMVDSVSSKNLKMMAKKWKALKLQIVKKSDDKILKISTYRFNTNFPKNYFAPDAIQIITITANYSASFNTSSTSFSLQGIDVVDNNYVIASDNNTVYINILNFDFPETGKINGFTFESFIYNDSEVIELEPIYITLK